MVPVAVVVTFPAGVSGKTRPLGLGDGEGLGDARGLGDDAAVLAVPVPQAAAKASTPAAAIHVLSITPRGYWSRPDV
jgi:hypothetical protein